MKHPGATHSSLPLSLEWATTNNDHSSKNKNKKKKLKGRKREGAGARYTRVVKQGLPSFAPTHGHTHTPQGGKCGAPKDK